MDTALSKRTCRVRFLSILPLYILDYDMRELNQMKEGKSHGTFPFWYRGEGICHAEESRYQK
jgi:hypothetical protein